MIAFQNVSYSIPEKDLYRDISFTIQQGGHYALIGSNGTGKTTLLQMMLHEEDYLYDGKILLEEEFQSSRVGYSGQFLQMEEAEARTVFDYISRDFVILNQKIEAICEEMGRSENLEEIFEEYQKLLDEKEAIDGDNYERNIQKQLQLANLEGLSDRQMSALSGGEYKLISVIREMLLSPSVMIMDEPDVFLDFDHVNALIHLINGYKGTLIVVTHSRFLLQHCFDHILHLEGCMINSFEGNYEAYTLELLTLKVETEEAAQKDQLEIERQEAIVKKKRALATAFDNASLGRSLHARQTLLDRLKERQTKLPFINIRRPAIRFSTEEADLPEASEVEPILTFSDYEASFGEELLTGITLSLMPGEKAAIVGRNGTGKTTILKDIMEGKKDSISLREGTRLSVFSQLIHSTSSDKTTVRDALEEAGMIRSRDMEDYIRTFGFTGEELKKPLSTLSGGERDLMELALLSLKPMDLLLLDEPTGHLDLYAKEALERAIREYTGSILMVSHDFYSIASCMDYVLLVEDHEIRKMSIRKFRQMVYRHHFDKEELLLEDRKKKLQTGIEADLEKHDYESAETKLAELEEVTRNGK